MRKITKRHLALLLVLFLWTGGLVHAQCWAQTSKAKIFTDSSAVKADAVEFPTKDPTEGYGIKSGPEPSFPQELDRDKIARLRNDVIDIKRDFGAKGDGNSDDTNAIQAAASAAAGSTLYFPSTGSSYKLTKAIVVPANTKVTGNGFGSRIKQTSAEMNAFELADNSEISQLNIEGPETGRGAVDLMKGNGIFVSLAKNIRIMSNFIHGWNGAGIQVREGFNLIISANMLYQNTGNSSESDILFYSGRTGGRAIIANNHCLSNNSQGIGADINGGDSDISIMGNICVTLDNSWKEMNERRLVRRHGIIVGYNGVEGVGRLVVIGNVIRNTLWTGIYRAVALGGIPVAANISSNVISLVGLQPGQSISGGIMLNGAGRNDLVAGNSIYDYRGTIAAAVGAITCSQSSAAGQLATFSNNVISKSTGHGIVLKGAVANVNVNGNVIEGSAGSDIEVNPDAGITGVGNVSITDNKVTRSLNGTAPAIRFNAQSGTLKSIIDGNTILGLNSTFKAWTNSGIHITASFCPMSVRNNKIRNTYFGIYFASAVKGRVFDLFLVDYNQFDTMHDGIVLRGVDPSPVVPLEGNIFRNVTNRISGDGFYPVGFIATRAGYTIQVHDMFSAVPTTGTWAVGDYASQKIPAVGMPKGWICVTAGSPGVWVSVGNL